MNHFQLVDLDGDICGIVKTNLNSETVAKEWVRFYDEVSTDIEDFIDYLNETRGEDTAERFFIDGIINP